MTLLFFVVDLLGNENRTSKGRIIVTLVFAVRAARIFPSIAGAADIVDEAADK